MDYERINLEIIKTLSKYNIFAIYLFGSCYRKELKESSDIDIAILGELNIDDRLTIISELTDKLHRNIDLVLFDRVDTSFQAEILYNSEAIYNADNDLKAKTEFKVYSKYLTLQEDRAIVINSIYDRGTIYEMEAVILNKVESIERCIKRIKEVVNYSDFSLKNFDHQDSILLNLQRACQQSIDLAMYIVSQKSLGLPKTSKEAFTILEKNSILSKLTRENLGKMVGFRNIIIHEYQEIELEAINYILENRLNDFKLYTTEIIKFLKNDKS